MHTNSSNTLAVSIWNACSSKLKPFINFCATICIRSNHEVNTDERNGIKKSMNPVSLIMRVMLNGVIAFFSPFFSFSFSPFSSSSSSLASVGFYLYFFFRLLVYGTVRNEMRFGMKSIPNMVYSNLVHVFRIRRERAAAVNVYSLLECVCCCFFVIVPSFGTAKSLFFSWFSCFGLP